MTFRHWAGVSSYTLACALAETCVLDKQLLGPLFCDHFSVVPLIPKLRGHFAEFLNKGSPVRLRIFFSSTCVGLRYGYLRTFSSFSRRRKFGDFVSLVHSPSQPSLLTCVLHYKPASLLGRAFPSARFSYLSVSLQSLTPSVVQEYLPAVHHIRLSAST